MQFLDSFAPLEEQYDGYILDLWGVVHDGSNLYPGVKETLVRLKDRGAKVVFLSNAPRRIPKVVSVLTNLGVTQDLYLSAFSSGEAGALALEKGEHVPGRRYYYIGPPKDEDVLDGLSYEVVQDIGDADFVLNVGFGSESQSGDAWEGVLQEAKARDLRMICLNPDMEVVKITGERFPCAGVIARDYEQIGGEVVYFGKPFPQVYDEVFRLMSDVPKSRILAVGDSLHTDILGASRVGVKSALATGGILKQELGSISSQEMLDYLTAQPVQPDYVVAGLS